MQHCTIEIPGKTHFSAADLINAGREWPLSVEAAERHFAALDAIDRFTFRAPFYGPVEKRTALEKLTRRMLASGQPVFAGEIA